MIDAFICVINAFICVIKAFICVIDAFICVINAFICVIKAFICMIRAFICVIKAFICMIKAFIYSKSIKTNSSRQAISMLLTNNSVDLPKNGTRFLALICSLHFLSMLFLFLFFSSPYTSNEPSIHPFMSFAFTMLLFVHALAACFLDFYYSYSILLFISIGNIVLITKYFILWKPESAIPLGGYVISQLILGASFFLQLVNRKHENVHRIFLQSGPNLLCYYVQRNLVIFMEIRRSLLYLLPGIFLHFNFACDFKSINFFIKSLIIVVVFIATKEKQADKSNGHRANEECDQHTLGKSGRNEHEHVLAGNSSFSERTPDASDLYSPESLPLFFVALSFTHACVCLLVEYNYGCKCTYKYR